MLSNAKEGTDAKQDEQNQKNSMHSTAILYDDQLWGTKLLSGKQSSQITPRDFIKNTIHSLKKNY